MSRSGYTDDYGDDDPLAMGRYRAAVASAMNGRRGQALLRELLAALDAMPEKRLEPGSFVQAGGGCCALGAVALARGMDVSDLEPQPSAEYGWDDDGEVDAAAVGARFDVAESMAREVMYMNDEAVCWPHGSVERFRYVRAWVESSIKEATDAT